MQLNLIVIRIAQPKVLSEFYEHLGIKFEYHRHGEGAWHYSTTIDKVVFEIYPLMKSQELADRSVRLGFTVDQLDYLISQLKKQGVEITKAPTSSEWGYFAVVKDLDGRKIELKEK